MTRHYHLKSTSRVQALDVDINGRLVYPLAFGGEEFATKVLAEERRDFMLGTDIENYAIVKHKW
ncbi:hypothetical protein KAR91_36395 [Candidatus Pacearchaeota archaeon]|nr:hypothetical protein [Candidatus Pacearchaeota archaeon]